ncbi:MAG: GPR endopeptidase [Oscillospiraceae bacterium]|nr:GPR endopeptidase [Oscillospiraceae bacterium]
MPKSGTIRTDLALEARQLWQERAGTEALSGVRAVDREREGFAVHVVEILDESGEAALGKPRGRYVTVELDGLLRRETDAFPRAASALAAELRELLALDADGSCLVAGLGNRDITPDAIGPDVVSHIIVTRHLKERLPEDFARLRPVSAICTGVLGTTGIESGELVRTVCASLRPDCVIAVDALASRSPDRLCRTVQLSDTGIVPGSGVGNARQALNRETLGVPVIAVGVPTVVDAATLTLDLAARGGVKLSPAAFGELGSMIVTPRDVDKTVRDVGKLIGYAVNLALHEGMTVEEIDQLVS